MHINLVDTNLEIVAAWQQVFADVPQVTICHGSIFDYPADALVSPANSFGYMNGGIDFAISKHLGWHLEKDLQRIIREKYYGELLVGQAEILPTGSAHFPYLIAAPAHDHHTWPQCVSGYESYFGTPLLRQASCWRTN